MTKVKSDIAFAQNYQNLYFIDTNPGGEQKYERIGAGINSATWNPNETVNTVSYYDSEGGTESSVDGVNITGSFSGHRKYGDPAQDYIFSKMGKIGSERTTNAKWVQPNGDTFEGPAKLLNIVPQGGDPNSKSECSFDVAFDGLPTYTAGDATTFPTELQASEVSVVEGQTSAVEVTVTPEGAAKQVVFGIDDDSIATVDAEGTVTGVKQGSTRLSIKSAVKPSVVTVIDVEVTSGPA